MNKFYHILKTLFLFGWSLFVVFPFLWALTTSFKDANAITSGATYIPWVDYEPSTQGWTSLFTTGSQGINIVGPFIDSAAVTLIASLVSLALGTLAAYGLSRFEYRLGLGGTCVVFFPPSFPHTGSPFWLFLG